MHTNVFNVVRGELRLAVFVEVANRHRRVLGINSIQDVHHSDMVIMEKPNECVNGKIAKVARCRQETHQPYCFTQTAAFLARNMLHAMNIGILRGPLSEIPFFARHFSGEMRSGAAALT